MIGSNHAGEISKKPLFSTRDRTALTLSTKVYFWAESTSKLPGEQMEEQNGKWKENKASILQELQQNKNPMSGEKTFKFRYLI